MPVIDTQQRKWLLCLGISVGALLLTYWPQGLLHFRYDRAALLSGQAWRLLTAPLVHLNTFHLLLNLFGLALICELLWGALPCAHGLGLLAAAALGASGLLWLLHPELAWYAGLSGALHGLWAGCALAGCWPTAQDAPSSAPLSRWPLPRWLSVAALLLLIVKLVLEWRHGASLRTVHLIGGPVVVAAHLYGALIGIGYLLIWRAIQATAVKK